MTAPIEAGGDGERERLALICDESARLDENFARDWSEEGGYQVDLSRARAADWRRIAQILRSTRESEMSSLNAYRKERSEWSAKLHGAALIGEPLTLTPTECDALDVLLTCLGADALRSTDGERRGESVAWMVTNPSDAVSSEPYATTDREHIRFITEECPSPHITVRPLIYADRRPPEVEDSGASK